MKEFICETCGNAFTIIPEPTKPWINCLSVECPSYGTKTIKVSNKTHRLLKEYCNRKQFKMNAWADRLVLDRVEWLNDVELTGKKRDENVTD